MKPVHYDVSLFGLEFGGSWGYKGIVKIDTKITRPAKEISLNSKEIEVQDADIFAKDGVLHDPVALCKRVRLLMRFVLHCSRKQSCQGI